MIQHLAVQMRAAIAEHADRPATRIRVGDDWCTHTFREFGERIDEAAQGLLNRGIRPGDRIGLFANNCPEWSEIDFGAATVRAIPVPIYARNRSGTSLPIPGCGSCSWAAAASANASWRSPMTCPNWSTW